MASRRRKTESLVTTDRARLARAQSVIRKALARMADKRHSEMDQSFYSDWRQSLLDAGATETEIEAQALFFVTRVMEETTPADAEFRREQLELIAHHLACTEMHVRISKDDQCMRVDFPDRPKRN